MINNLYNFAVVCKLCKVEYCDVNLKLLYVVCSVFWDLYCAAPERRDTCEHSSEAKAFHDYVSTTSRADPTGTC